MIIVLNKVVITHHFLALQMCQNDSKHFKCLRNVQSVQQSHELRRKNFRDLPMFTQLKAARLEKLPPLLFYPITSLPLDNETPLCHASLDFTFCRVIYFYVYKHFTCLYVYVLCVQYLWKP